MTRETQKILEYLCTSKKKRPSSSLHSNKCVGGSMNKRKEKKESPKTRRFKKKMGLLRIELKFTRVSAM